MANTDAILQMYSYFNSGDLDKIRAEIFHPEITWRMPGHHPLSGQMNGADEVIAFFSDLSKAGIEVDNVHFGELDNGTVVEKHMGHGEADGEKFLFPTATTYEFEDGKIRAVQVHTADQHGVDRYMWTRFTLKPIIGRLQEA
jgi:ketosteroid isomerase-like protein